MDFDSMDQNASNITSESLEKNQLNALINSMADGVIAINDLGQIVLSNGAALNILDINSTLSGQSISDVMHLFDKNNQPVDIKSLILNTKTQLISRDWQLHYNDGSVVHLYFSAAPVHQSFGSASAGGFVLLIRDITREKSLEEERDEFISVISHELRTPIAIAEAGVSNAQLLAERQNVNESVLNSLQATHDQILFLSNMINDLSTLSRAERGKLEINLESINIKELLDSLVRDYKAQADAKNLNLKTDYTDSTPTLTSSRLYVKEVLQNFITNAIKYTEQGSVTISCEPNQQGALFKVIDTGIGISKNDQEKVFDKFFRSEDFRTRANNGTGLGLYVTMKLARMLHAEIDLTSELNKGTTFSIFIPSLKVDAEQAHQA